MSDGANDNRYFCYFARSEKVRSGIGEGVAIDGSGVSSKEADSVHQSMSSAPSLHNDGMTHPFSSSAPVVAMAASTNWSGVAARKHSS